MLYILEYVWLDGKDQCRSKTKVCHIETKNKTGNLQLKDVPKWNYDGSSTGQATTQLSEVILRPVRLYKDCFRRNAINNTYLVLCDTYNTDDTPHETNMRHKAKQLFDEANEEEPMFGLEQEFFISTKINKHVGNEMVGVVPNGYSKSIDDKIWIVPGKHYCGVGGFSIYERNLMERAMDNLIYSSINITGMNAEVSPSQWEFQVCAVGIEASDDLIMLRYICNRTFESEDLFMDLLPKTSFLQKRNENGSGCHINFSTKKMRQPGGFKVIERAITNLSKQHDLHIKHYGSHNEMRLTGKNETSDLKTFSFGIGSRDTSIRIPIETKKNKCGYFEDRRPSSTLNPYVSTSLLFATSVGIKQFFFE